MKFRLLVIVLVALLQCCVSKQDVLYLQDAKTANGSELLYAETTIQPDDILKITVGALVPDAALPYNKGSPTSVQNSNIDIMKLEGYVVSKNYTIDFPVLGVINAKQRTTQQLGDDIKQLLETGGHLTNPTVDVRLLNGKFTVLGEVNKPGTYNFTENKLTVLQALGLAGDLTITGQRKDVVLIREVDGKRQISHIDLTTTNWFDTDLYYVKPGDVLMINPNTKKVKSSGMIGDTSTILGVASLVLSITILLTN